MTIPYTVRDFKKHGPPFQSWIQERGAVIYPPTNPYELLRFDAVGGVAVVYRKKGGVLTWPEPAMAAWLAYQGNKGNWRPTSKQARATKGARRRIAAIRCLAKRDGMACLYCGVVLTDETATIEHVVPLSQGGVDRLINMALACKECNHGLGDLPPAKKFAYALAKRKEPHP